ncbi:MAG: PTS sugar transporter subunit IIB [Candidatus Eisenbacteria bacterium]|nr:PTS sugar transporter subunit IIB [Candidatus Eisenbacteria bacterium]
MAGASYLLFRIDDRLLHGQVALGWGMRLHPAHYLIVDDETAGDPLACSLYAAAAPEGTDVACISVAEATAAGFHGPDPESTVLLVRGVEIAARLLRAGIPGPVNLGGLHLRPGAVERAPALFLTPEDETTLGRLVQEGFLLSAQDLPTTRPRPVGNWIHGEGGGAR